MKRAPFICSMLLPILSAAAPLAAQEKPAAVNAAAASAAPVSIIRLPETVTAASPVELVFPSDMVAADMTGKTTPAADVLVSKPTLTAELSWTSPRSAVVKLAAPLALGSTHSLALRSGLKDAAGKPVPAGQAVTISGPAFAVRQTLPRWFDMDVTGARLPEIVLFFNDSVDAAAVAKAGRFVDKAERAVKIKTWTPEVVQLGKTHPLTGTWTEQSAALAKGTQQGAAGQAAMAVNVVTIKPESPLPPGEEWTLRLDAGLPNASGTAALPAYSLAYGTILPFKLAEVEAEPVLDGPRELHVTFNKDVPELTPEQWAKHISIDPRPVALAWKAEGQTVTATGGFEMGAEYKVMVAEGIKSKDGCTLGATEEKQITFQAHAPHLSLPGFDTTQWLNGAGVYEFVTANTSSVDVQVKRIPATHAVLALRGYEAYKSEETEEGRNLRIPYATVPGRTVMERAFKSAVELDQSERLRFTWDEACGGKREPGIYFISATANSKDGVTPEQKLGGEAIVQLTDIGMAWKTTASGALIYCFSHTSGLPVEGVKLTSFSDDSDELESVATGADGMGTLKFTVDKNTAAWLIASKGKDMHGIPFRRDMPVLSMWSFDLPYSERAPDKAWRELFIFTERPVYQPEETLFFKAISRMHSSEGLTLPPEGEAARLRIYDPKNRIIVDRTIHFSAFGSCAEGIRLPARNTGWHRLSIAFEPKRAAAADPAAPPSAPVESDEDQGDEEGGQAAFEQQFLVQDYQPNTFKIDFADGAVEKSEKGLTVPLRASYLMGKPLGKAQVSWHTEITPRAFAPAKWDGWRFGRAASTYVWDGQAYHSLPEADGQGALTTGSGKSTLNDKGALILEAPVPALAGVPGPRIVSLSAEITDLNQQTIAATWDRTLHSSEFYLGIQRGDNAMRAGQEMTLTAAAVQPDGSRLTSPVAAKVTVEHLTWNAVRVQTAGGGSEVRNDLVFAKVSESDFTVSSEPGRESTFKFKPAAAGTHYLTFSARDAGGAEVRTVVSVDVFGADGLTWVQDDPIKIELVPDKDRYAPGGIARIIVKTPVTGTALVTVERGGVLMARVQPLAAGGMIEIPVTESWSPNVFVSVTHVRGGADDPREIKMPDYRQGFCELRIDSTAHQLNLALAPAQAEVRPGAMVEISATATDADGKPLPKTEIALWAVDEGILSLMPWEAPDPSTTFLADESLYTGTGISLNHLQRENQKELEFNNKGFVIGGGGEERGDGMPMRRNFRATAYWHGSLLTGDDGSVKVSFPAPDNLTTFRIVAVGSEGASRFGKVESKFTVNKPLMLEPAMPRFANAGDEITLKAVLHNTTTADIPVQVELTLDEHTTLLEGLNGLPVPGKTAVKSISLPAKGSKAALFTVKFLSDGPVAFKWKATGGAPDLADSVESTLQVGIAEPLLHEVSYLRLTDADNGRNLTEKVRPEVMAGAGDVMVTLANSRIVEGAGAVDQLLQYPYGCAEQTSSAMLPWLTMRDLKKAVPKLNRPDEEIAGVVQKGVDRLLSMQTRSGGLAYWPGGTEPNAWATAHGGAALVLASRLGAQVPEVRLKSILDWLSKSLRSAKESKAPHDYTERAYALWTLAMAGKPESSYHELLFGKMEQLPASARALLALSVAESNGPADMAHGLLAFSTPNEPADWHAGRECVTAIRALTLLKLKDPAASEEMDALISARCAAGDWRHTFNNAWALMALAKEAAQAPPWPAGQPVVLTMEGENKEINFPATPAAESLSFARQASIPVSGLSLRIPAGARVFARVEVTGRQKPGPQPARDAGFSISRSIRKLDALGAPTADTSFKTGDLLMVTLTVDVPGQVEYLVIDDPLPATLEGVNPNFTSMTAQVNHLPTWTCDYIEMRRDRVVFFRDWSAAEGKFALHYLARVVAEGDVMAPPAKVEMMYDPSRFGLSPSDHLRTTAGDTDEIAGK